MLILSDRTDLVQFCIIIFLFFIRNVFCIAFIIRRFSSVTRIVSARSVSFIIRGVWRNRTLYGSFFPFCTRIYTNLHV